MRLLQAYLMRRWKPFDVLGYNPIKGIINEGRCQIYGIRNSLQLKIAYDVPQIYTAHNAKTGEAYLRLLDDTKPYRAYIEDVHPWGKKMSETGRKIAHCGNLDTYFGDTTIKEHFLQGFKDCFDDGVARKMVLEVNSGNEDLQSIVSDLKDAGVRFV